jgi:hypothetical protein
MSARRLRRLKHTQIGIVAGRRVGLTAWASARLGRSGKTAVGPQIDHRVLAHAVVTREALAEKKGGERSSVVSCDLSGS